MSHVSGIVMTASPDGGGTITIACLAGHVLGVYPRATFRSDPDNPFAKARFDRVQGRWVELGRTYPCPHDIVAVTPMQIDLLPDPVAAQRGKEEGTQRALDTRATWAEAAVVEIEKWARAGVEFTSEDITVAVGLPSGVVETNRNNAVGAIMAASAARGIIHKTGEYRSTKRKASHARVVAVWKGGRA